ncbi:MAG: hypothetical protein Q4C63_01460 [Eubacteriales bacterium]|nr:hypothetical protein [Eubacteriales bacterium]
MNYRSALILGAAVLMAAVSTGLSGCAPTEQTVVMRGPDFSQTKDVALDFVQIHNDTIDAFGDAETNPYVYINNLNVSGDNDSKTVTIEAVCMDDTTKEEAEQFAAAAVRHVNDAAVTQSNEYELSSQESFGTLFSKYALTLSVKPESTEDDESTWLIDLKLNPGDEIPLDPDIETYEEEWADERDRILESLQDQAIVLQSSASEEAAAADESTAAETTETAETAETSEADTAESPASAVD